MSSNETHGGDMVQKKGPDVEPQSEQETTITRFTQEAQRLAQQMKRQQNIFGAGYSTDPSNPMSRITPEQRTVASGEYDRIYSEYVQSCAELFRIVGGPEALTIVDKASREVPKKHGYREGLDSSLDFYKDLLVAATVQPRS